MQELINVPNTLIHNNFLGDKRVLAYSSFLFSGLPGNKIEDIVTYSGFYVRRHCDGVLNQYRDLFYHFIEQGYISEDGDILVSCTRDDCYGVIYRSEFERILRIRKSCLADGLRVNHSHLLLLLSHIRLCMLRQQGVPAYYSNLLNRISDRIGISVRSISAALKTLEELDILHYEELPRYKDEKGYWHSNVKVFTNKSFPSGGIRNWRAETSRCVEHIMSSQIN